MNLKYDKHCLYIDEAKTYWKSQPRLTASVKECLSAQCQSVVLPLSIFKLDLVVLYYSLKQ